MAVSTSLVAHWHFKEDQTLEDRINGLTWTLDSGGPTVFSSDGLELSDGTPVYSITGLSTYLPSPGEVAIYCEFQIDGTASVNQRTFSIGIDENNMLALFVNTSEQTGFNVLQGGSVSAAFAGSVLSLDTTTRAGMYAGANSYRLAVNGTFAGAEDTSGQIPTSYDDAVMSQRFIAGRPHLGPIAELRLYDSKSGDTDDRDQFIDDLSNGLITEESEVSTLGLSSSGRLGGTRGKSHRVYRTPGRYIR